MIKVGHSFSLFPSSVSIRRCYSLFFPCLFVHFICPSSPQKLINVDVIRSLFVVCRPCLHYYCHRHIAILVALTSTRIVIYVILAKLYSIKHSMHPPFKNGKYDKFYLVLRISLWSMYFRIQFAYSVCCLYACVFTFTRF